MKLFTVKEAEILFDQESLPHYSCWTCNDDTASIILNVCCAWGMASGYLACNENWAYGGFSTQNAGGCIDSGRISRLSGGFATPSVFLAVAQRVIMDTMYAGFKSGASDQTMIGLGPSIVEKGLKYFPIANGETSLNTVKQVAISPRYVTNPQAPESAKAINLMCWAGMRSWIFGSKEATLAKSVLVMNSGAIDAMNYIHMQEAISRMLDKYPEYESLLIMDGYDWSPSNPVTKDIARQMWDPTYSCPIGQQSKAGGGCEPVVCQTGQILQGSQCVPIACPSGTHLVGSACVADTAAGGGTISQFPSWALPVGIALLLVLLLRGD